MTDPWANTSRRWRDLPGGRRPFTRDRENFFVSVPERHLRSRLWTSRAGSGCCPPWYFYADDGVEPPPRSA